MFCGRGDVGLVGRHDLFDAGELLAVFFERDEAVSRKSAWLAYRIVANGCWAAGIAALVIYGISRMPAALAVTVTLDAVAIAAFAALLGAEVYYEKRM